MKAGVVRHLQWGDVHHAQRRDMTEPAFPSEFPNDRPLTPEELTALEAMRVAQATGDASNSQSSSLWIYVVAPITGAAFAVSLHAAMASPTRSTAT